MQEIDLASILCDFILALSNELKWCPYKWGLNYRFISILIYIFCFCFIYLSFYLSIYLSIDLHVCIYLSIHLSIFLYAHPSVCLSVCLDRFFYLPLPLAAIKSNTKPCSASFDVPSEFRVTRSSLEGVSTVGLVAPDPQIGSLVYWSFSAKIGYLIEWALN